jgi:MFS family permease
VPAGLVGTSMGFLSTMMDIGQTLGPIISGIIFASSLQYLGLFFSLSVILATSSVIFILSKRQTPKKTPKYQRFNADLQVN